MKNNETQLYVEADPNPFWIDNSEIITEKFSEPDFVKILIFFLIKTPVIEFSARSRSLESYGVKNTYELKKKLKIIPASNGIFIFADSLKEMRDALSDSGLLNQFGRNLNNERCCFYIKKNHLNSVFYHIRNAFAHGRFSIVEKDNDWIFIMEDISFKKVSGRMIFKKSTLLNWIEIIENGKLEHKY